jgi:hypothetical protein
MKGVGQLFICAPLLVDARVDFPEAQIVLSMSWAQPGTQACRSDMKVFAALAVGGTELLGMNKSSVGRTVQGELIGLLSTTNLRAGESTRWKNWYTPFLKRGYRMQARWDSWLNG